MEVDDNFQNTTNNPISAELETATYDSQNGVNTENNIIDIDFNIFTSNRLLELCKSSWVPSANAKSNIQLYLRGCKWSPDGTCCLTVVNNDGVHVIELPRDLYEDNVSIDRPIDILDSVIHVKESGLVYDFCWYPGMNSSLPETCCWLTTLQNSPIQMWDAFDGSLRCSYRGFNQVDELETALSLSFTLDGSKIIAGYKKCLKTFDVSRPGRDYSNHKITQSASCLVTEDNLLAVGSWNTSISLYSIKDMGTYKSIGKMHGHCGGVTHMKFAQDGLKLVSGGRIDNNIYVWDMRNYRKPLNILSRVVTTNQRIYFDISPCGRYLVSGGTDGVVRVWDSNSIDWINALSFDNMNNPNSVTYIFPLHEDCCNSVAIHPFKKILATGSGQLHLKDPINSLENNVDNCKNNEPINRENNTTKYSKHCENDLVF